MITQARPTAAWGSLGITKESRFSQPMPEKTSVTGGSPQMGQFGDVVIGPEVTMGPMGGH